MAKNKAEIVHEMGLWFIVRQGISSPRLDRPSSIIFINPSTKAVPYHHRINTYSHTQTTISTQTIITTTSNMGGNSVTTFGGASKQTPNIRAHKATPTKNPAKVAATGKQVHNRAAAKKGGNGGQKQSASIAASVAAVPQPTVSVSSKRTKDTPVFDTPACTVDAEVEDTTVATVTTNRSARNAKNDHLQKQADRILADPARHLSVSPKKSAKGLKDSVVSGVQDSNDLSSSGTFGEKVEQKLESKVAKRDVNAGRKNKPKKAGANEKDRHEFRSVY